MKSLKCEMCGSEHFFWIGYVEEEKDSNNQFVVSTLGYKCFKCKEIYRITILEDKQNV